MSTTNKPFALMGWTRKMESQGDLSSVWFSFLIAGYTNFPPTSFFYKIAQCYNINGCHLCSTVQVKDVVSWCSNVIVADRTIVREWGTKQPGKIFKTPWHMYNKLSWLHFSLNTMYHQHAYAVIAKVWRNYIVAFVDVTVQVLTGTADKSSICDPDVESPAALRKAKIP